MGLFVASGAAGIVYEISWSRQFGDVFGHTPHTAALVLSSFLGGLAVGYWLAGRAAARRHPLLEYGVLELIAAGWCCLVPLMLAGLARLLPALIDADSLSLLGLLRAAACFLLLLPSTAALGATWPRMAAFLSPRWAPSARLLSWGYAFNTFGAMLGAAAAPAFLLAVVGVTKSSYLAAAVSAACGVGAIALARGQVWNAGNAEPASNTEEEAAEPHAWRWWLLVAFSGFAILALEVLYLRLFSLVFHNSTYTFAGVIALFLLALAAGAGIVGLIGRKLSTGQVAGLACAGGAIAIGFSLAAFAQWTGFRYFTAGDSFLGYSAAALLLVFVVVFPPITLFGTILPTAWRALDPTDRGKGRVAGLTAVSTLAGATGSLVAGFGLPHLGLWSGFALLGGIYLVLGAAILIRCGTCLQWLVLVVIALPVLDLAWRTQNSARTLLPGDTLLRRWESDYGWIDAVQLPDSSRYIRQNLHYGFGNSRRSVRRDYRQGHVPLLLHGNPRKVAFLGMGTGQTAAAALAHEELEEIVVVELIPEAVEAARYLSESNRGLVDHPRVEIHVGDARRFLRASGRKFDVITADLFVPWESQTGYLYTVEHYLNGIESLEPGGVFCQWLPLYQMGADDFELIADSFASVFPYTTLWWAQLDPAYPVLGLIGSREPVEFPGEEQLENWPKFELPAGGFDPWLENPSQVLALRLGRWHVRRPERLNTEEHPRVEFSAPIAHGDRSKMQRARLAQFFNEVLTKLPEEGVHVTVPEPSRGERLARQRGLLETTPRQPPQSLPKTVE